MATDTMASAATATLIQVQGGRRWCLSCSRLQPAETFTSRPGNRCRLIRCGQCSERAAAARKARPQS